MKLTKNIKEVIHKKEDYNLVYRPIPPSSFDLATLISSLANTNGGVVVLGVITKSNGVIDVRGLSNDFKTTSILNRALNLISPKIDVVSGQISLENKNLFVVEVAQSDKPLLVEGRKYVRIKDKTLPEKEDELKDISKQHRAILAALISSDEKEISKELKEKHDITLNIYIENMLKDNHLEAGGNIHIGNLKKEYFSDKK